VVDKLDSQLKGRGFKSHPILYENGFKAMPTRFLYPILVKSSNEEIEITGSQMRHTKKIFFKVYSVSSNFRTSTPNLALFSTKVFVLCIVTNSLIPSRASRHVLMTLYKIICLTVVATHWTFLMTNVYFSRIYTTVRLFCIFYFFKLIIPNNLRF